MFANSCRYLSGWHIGASDADFCAYHLYHIDVDYWCVLLGLLLGVIGWCPVAGILSKCLNDGFFSFCFSRECIVLLSFDKLYSTLFVISIGDVQYQYLLLCMLGLEYVAGQSMFAT